MFNLLRWKNVFRFITLKWVVPKDLFLSNKWYLLYRQCNMKVLKRKLRIFFFKCCCCCRDCWCAGSVVRVVTPQHRVLHCCGHRPGTPLSCYHHLVATQDTPVFPRQSQDEGLQHQLSTDSDSSPLLSQHSPGTVRRIRYIQTSAEPLPACDEVLWRTQVQRWWHQGSSSNRNW